jgi:hypothetical protein
VTNIKDIKSVRLSKPLTDANPAGGNYIICHNVGKPSTFCASYPQIPGSYTKLEPSKTY